MPNKPIRVRYVPLPGGEAVSHDEKRTQASLWGAVVQQMENHPGCLEFLRLRCMESEGFAYYSRALGGILADFTDLDALEDCPRNVPKLVFGNLDKYRSMQVCHLNAGLLQEWEYLILQEITAAEERKALASLTAAVLEPPGAAEACRIHGDGETAYGIPIFRCAWDENWAEPENADELLSLLIRKGFLPDFGSVGGLPPQELWMNLKGMGSSTLPTLVKADAKGSAEERKRWEKIMEFYRGTGKRTADLVEYPDSVLLAQGSWDLYPFVKMERTSLRPEDGPWCEVSGLFARDPRGDLASDAEYVAIDFGTTSTVAAVYQNNGAITSIPVGGGEKYARIDNPTILKFTDLAGFLKAYQEKDFRPDTSFNQVSASHKAQRDFESPSRRHVLQYLNQLKQWVNNPDRTIRLMDQGGDREITLDRKMQADTLTVDPIELYAYYIGLSLNDMRWGKVYRKYLLSYSATYSEYSREWIRASFEKGLRKSLPQEVGKDTKIDVRLWRDEATCYAVCALNRCLLADEEHAWDLEQGIFYGVYDFGGGTLDFSFGVVTMDPKTETQHFQQFKCGGSPVMGCENILDELAFDIFSQNYEMFKQQKLNIRCCIPIGADPRQHLNSPVASESEAARYNTCSLTAFLRQKWIFGGKKTGTDALMPEDRKEPEYRLKLMDEDGKTYEWTGKAGKPENGIIEVNISDAKIETFFQKKVMEGMELFLDCWRRVVSEQEGEQQYRSWPCHVFLAGSASQAPRVWKAVQTLTQMVQDGEGDAPTFVPHRPLPTEEDRKAQKDDPTRNIPTAKSGVAYGLLMSRPGAEDVVIEQKAPEVAFHYHIGRKTKSAQNGGTGKFHLLCDKAAIPKYESGTFRWVREIQEQVFELLYTFDDSYAMAKSDRDVNSSVRVAAVQIPESCRWQEQQLRQLYICAEQSSSTAAELALSHLPPNQNGTLERGQIKVIGTCDFAQGTFSPNEGAAPELADQPPANIEPYIPENNKHYSVGYLPPDDREPRWITDTVSLKKKTVFGDFREECFTLCWKLAGEVQWEQLPIPLKGIGKKRISLLEAAPTILRFRCWPENEEQYTFVVDLHTRKIQKEE